MLHDMTSLNLITVIINIWFVCLPSYSKPPINMNKLSEILNPSNADPLTDKTSDQESDKPLEDKINIVTSKVTFKPWTFQQNIPKLLIFDKHDFPWVGQLVGGAWTKEHETRSGDSKEDGEDNDRPDDAGRIVNHAGQRRNPGNPVMSSSIKTSIPIKVYQPPHYHNDYDYYDYHPSVYVPPPVVQHVPVSYKNPPVHYGYGSSGSHHDVVDRYGPSHDDIVYDYVDDDYKEISVTATVTKDECSWGWFGWIFCLF